MLDIPVACFIVTYLYSSQRFVDVFLLLLKKLVSFFYNLRYFSMEDNIFTTYYVILVFITCVLGSQANYNLDWLGLKSSLWLCVCIRFTRKDYEKMYQKLFMQFSYFPDSVSFYASNILWNTELTKENEVCWIHVQIESRHLYIKNTLL